MQTPTTIDRTAFPFFRLPRELRDNIYEDCDGNQQVSLAGDGTENIKAWVEHGLRTNFLLVCKQFSREYWMRQRGQGKLIIDATFYPARSTSPQLIDSMSNSKQMRIASGPKRVQAAELSTTWRYGWSLANCILHATILEALVFKLRFYGPITTAAKVYIVGEISGRWTAPKALNQVSYEVSGAGMVSLTGMAGLRSMELYSYYRSPETSVYYGMPAVLIGRWTQASGWHAKTQQT
ncbi:hypothetical protein CLAFUW4_08815 [Fulvia fulva]|uniref:Uncharacterized protein n=1 Tax=Passalora fulva TaxID=5499 RepID=A0A9Q8UTE8_PASFU|nr:uncharacterized protein CLAFUR5_08922 [Fulvia fulva]KAK4613488.1 hypothetical protein CLAFUR4_08821 [Fulvia fulva]KAK4614621.1 hypothetical protein CLAFUR0_08813 [Fulvia fulva]UJO21743.1 hypothetical protein CLAFUR5_08922 [Fulvia fulva]WPV20498.1 hypothetical protein CLAFUW4_08815 [Fulvia fulva]WPV35542.1 hypothetical protein CLAFUW7_08816 [Fulvia fulva]